VCLLFSDIEKSTALWERYGDAFSETLEIHNQELRTAIEEHGGYEVKTEGDAFMISFVEPRQAMRFAMTVQERLHQTAWPKVLLSDLEAGLVAGLESRDGFRGLRVRMGLHVGRPRCQPDPVTGRMDYFGRMVNRAARVEGVARGGQVVFSQAMMDALTASHWDKEGLVVTDLGKHTLRGLVGEEHLYQVLPRALASRIFGPLPAVPVPALIVEPAAIVEESTARWVVGQPATVQVAASPSPSNLPAPVASFVGRESDLEALSARFAGGQRLVTLLGPGGIGKTTLAVRFAALGKAEFPGGRWLCDLTSAHDRSGICSALADALEVGLAGDDDVTRLGNALVNRGRLLLVMNNFEGVVDFAAETVGVWHQHCPDVYFLATSRIPLRLAGEQQVPLDPLPVANLEDVSLEQVAANPAVRLFVDRARSARAEFVLGEDNLAAVVQLVRDLDGLPMAIELAAARARVLSPEQILDRLSRRFDLLRDGRRGGDSRTSTLRGTIDWSWELLEPWERAAFAQCSVFVGGFTLAAAEAVLDLAPWNEAPWPEDAIEALLDHSLVRALPPDPRGGEPRYQLLEMLREYGAEKLGDPLAVTFPDGTAATGAAPHEAAEQRHGGFYQRYGEQAYLDSLDEAGGVERRWALASERANLFAAAQRGIERGDGAVAAAAAAALVVVLRLQGPFAAGVDLLDKVLSLPGIPSSRRLRLVLRRGLFHGMLGARDRARTDFENARSLATADSDTEGVGLAGFALAGLLRFAPGEVEAALLAFEEALAMFRDSGARRLEGNVLADLAGHSRRLGRVEEAESYYQQALAVHREVGNQRGLAVALSGLGVLATEQGRLEEGASHYEAALVAHREVGSVSPEASTLNNLALLALNRGQDEEAEALFRESLHMCRSAGKRKTEATALGNLGDLYLERGDLLGASKELQAAVDLCQGIGFSLGEGAFRGSLGELQAASGRISEAREQFAAGERCLRLVGERLELAKLLCKRVGLERQAGQAETAAALLATAVELAEQLAVGPESDLGRHLAELQQGG
jgi:predicted ATPase/class 3 adenylate cyclase/Tfp pilus assembly protein PilF